MGRTTKCGDSKLWMEEPPPGPTRHRIASARKRRKHRTEQGGHALGEQEPVDAVPSLRWKAWPPSFGAAVLWAILAACGPPAEPTRSQNDSALTALPEIAQRIHLTPPRGSAQLAAAGTQVTYHGGAVVSNIEVIQVLYGPGSYLPEVASPTGRSMATFYQDVLNTRYFDWLDEDYNTVTPPAPRTNQHIGRGTFRGPLPVTPSAANAGPIISYTQVYDEIRLQIEAGRLPRPSVDDAGFSNTYYDVFFPPGITLQGVPCFGAAHGVTSNSRGIYYIGFHPALESCGSSGDGIFDFYTHLAAHELLETITDPVVGTAWFEGNASTGEIADLCPPGRILLSDGGIYLVSQAWSNAAQGCQVAPPGDSDFTLSIDGGVLSVRAGESTTLSFTTTLTRGVSQSLAMSVRGTAPGVATTYLSTPLEAGDTGAWTATAAANATPGTYDFTLVAAGATLTRTADFQVQVRPNNDWALQANQARVTLLPGRPATVTISGLVTKGSAEPVTLAPDISGLPPGVTATFSPATFTPGVSTSTLTFGGGGTPTAGPVTITYRATSATQPAGHTATLQVQVDSLPTVTWKSPPPGTSVSGTVGLSVTAAPGANTQVWLIVFSVDGLTIATGTANAVDWDTTLFSDGPHTMQVRVIDVDQGDAQASVTLNVSNSDFALTVNPSVATLLPGLPATLTISGRVTRGLAEPVTLMPTITGLPPGLSATFSPATFTPGFSNSTLTLSGGGTPTAGTVSITVRATSASQPAGHTVSAQVQVDTLPTLSWASPSSGTSVSGIVPLSVTVTPGANTRVRTVAFSVDGAPLATGTTNSFNWDTTKVPNGPHTVKARVTDDDNGAAEASATLIVSNASANDWSLTASPSGVTVLPGLPATLTIAGAVTRGVAEPVTLAPDISGLPPGVTATFSTSSFTPGISSSTLTLSGGGAPTVGPVSVTLRATSASQPAGHTATAQVQVDTLPAVTWASPADGTTVSGTVKLSVTAAPGANTQVRAIAFSVDGVTLAAGTASSLDWDTTKVPNGAHTVRAQVTDVDNGVAETSATLIVSNTQHPTTTATATGTGTGGSGCSSPGTGGGMPWLSLAILATLFRRSRRFAQALMGTRLR